MGTLDDGLSKPVQLVREGSMSFKREERHATPSYAIRCYNYGLTDASVEAGKQGQAHPSGKPVGRNDRVVQVQLCSFETAKWIASLRPFPAFLPSCLPLTAPVRPSSTLSSSELSFALGRGMAITVAVGHAAATGGDKGDDARTTAVEVLSLPASLPLSLRPSVFLFAFSNFVRNGESWPPPPATALSLYPSPFFLSLPPSTITEVEARPRRVVSS